MSKKPDFTADLKRVQEMVAKEIIKPYLEKLFPGQIKDIKIMWND